MESKLTDKLDATGTTMIAKVHAMGTRLVNPSLSNLDNDFGQ